MKICSKCKVEKELSVFSKDKNSIDGFYLRCKSCVKQDYLDNKEKIYNRIKKYRLDNKEKISNKQKQYYLDNKEKVKQNSKQYRLNNKEKISEFQNGYIKQRKKTDPLFKLKCNTRALIYQSIKNKGYSKKSKTANILGCDYETFKAHLENQFTKGMSWSNQGEWHLDHIYPVSLARDEAHLIELNHYTNFQPLWAIDNLKKGNKIQEKQLYLI